MKISKNQLMEIIEEELTTLREEAQSWSEIIIDKGVSALVEGTYDFDPPQEALDILEAKVRELLSDGQLQQILASITKEASSQTRAPRPRDPQARKPSKRGQALTVRR